MALSSTTVQTWIVREGLLLLLVGLVIGCGKASTPTTAPDGPAILLEPCLLSAPGLPTRLEAKCGTLAVYEDRVAQAGRQIDLRVAVLPALSRTPAPDPLFFITGGPGEAATQDYVRFASAFRRINEKRDIVLVDQRGTGQSHPLDCPLPDEEWDTDDDAALAAWLGACLDQLDADPTHYTTLVAVGDLDQVRAALGVDKVNLYGISYGTRVSLTYLRRYPEHVRTVILDGVLPQDEPLGLTISSDAQQALERIFARCAADAVCDAAFPDLPDAFAALLHRLEQGPVTVEISHPTTGESTEFEFTRDKLASTIRLLTYSPETVALLPLLIHTAQTTGDLSRLAAQVQMVTQQLESSISQGVNYAVICAEDVPFYSTGGTFAGGVEAERRGYLGETYRELAKLCAHWPAVPVSPGFKKPVSADVPVLLLSGEVDPVTPPADAEHAAATLSHSLHLVAPGQGHGIVLRGCVSRIATDFVERGTVEGLDTACVAEIRPPPFFVTFSGPNP